MVDQFGWILIYLQLIFCSNFLGCPEPSCNEWATKNQIHVSTSLGWALQMLGRKKLLNVELKPFEGCWYTEVTSGMTPENSGKKIENQFFGFTTQMVNCGIRKQNSEHRK